MEHATVELKTLITIIYCYARKRMYVLTHDCMIILGRLLVHLEGTLWHTLLTSNNFRLRYEIFLLLYIYESVMNKYCFYNRYNYYKLFVDKSVKHEIHQTVCTSYSDARVS